MAEELQTDAEEGIVKGPKSKMKLDMANWHLAWDRYALAAVVTNQVLCFHVPYRSMLLSRLCVAQMTFCESVKHKAVVAEVAAGAWSTSRKPILGVFYDEVARLVIMERLVHAVCCCSVCRKAWADLSERISPFELTRYLSTVDETLLRRATAAYDGHFQNIAAASKQLAGPKGSGKVMPMMPYAPVSVRLWVTCACHVCAHAGEGQGQAPIAR